MLKVLWSDKGLPYTSLVSGKTININPFPKQKILDSFKLKEFQMANFKLDENGIKFSKLAENTMGKWRNCLLRAISPFPAMFSKNLYCRPIKPGLWERVKTCTRIIVANFLLITVTFNKPYFNPFLNNNF